MNTINNTFPIHNQATIINHEHNKKTKNSNLELQKNFLEIFLSQIRNQDPINPLTNTELTSQLTEINTANGIEQINNNLISLKKQLNNNALFNMSSLIGHGILFPNSNIYYNDKHAKFGIDLEEGATSVNTEIFDQNGSKIFSKNIGPLTEGIHDWSWDGIKNDGSQANNGIYKFFINAKKGDKSINYTPLTYDKIQGICTSFGKNPLINLENFKTETKLQHVRKIF